MNIINKQSLGKSYCGVHENGHCSSGGGGELNWGIHKNEYCLPSKRQNKSELLFDLTQEGW